MKISRLEYRRLHFEGWSLMIIYITPCDFIRRCLLKRFHTFIIVYIEWERCYWDVPISTAVFPNLLCIQLTLFKLNYSLISRTLTLMALYFVVNTSRDLISNRLSVENRSIQSLLWHVVGGNVCVPGNLADYSSFSKTRVYLFVGLRYTNRKF